MSLFINSLDDLPLRTRVCLYGLGEGCYFFLDQLEQFRSDIEIITLIDDKKTVSPTPYQVIIPEQLSTGICDTILVTSAYWVAICKKLDSLSIGNYLVVNPCLLYKHLIMTSAEYAEWHDKFSKVQGLLDPGEQQNLYRLIVSSRSIQADMQQNLYDYYQNSHNHNLEYLEGVNPSSFLTIMEGGVFDGANTVEFASKIHNSGCVYGFEPNLDTATASRLSSLTSTIKLYPMALWSHKTVLSFYKNSANLQGARIVSNSSGLQELIEIPAISIDEFVDEYAIQKVDYIKLDVEGAELDVLQGSVKTLQRDRPQLAICIYHKKEHLYQIPLFLDSILENYCYHIGHYSPTFWDTVWYAIPEELKMEQNFIERNLL